MSRCLLLAGLAAPALPSRRAAAADPLKVAVGQRGAWDTPICVFGDHMGSFQETGVALDLLFTDGGAETQQAKLMPATLGPPT